MRSYISFATVLFLLAISIPTFAEPFFCNSYGEVNCAKNVADLVTKKFAKRFPASTYEIVMVANFDPYSDGGGVGFAIAGVSRRLLDKSKSSGPSLMPVNRFISTVRIDKGKYLGPRERTEETIQLMRRAVELLMDACEREERCDILATD